jgi:hypothetical protein
MAAVRYQAVHSLIDETRPFAMNSTTPKPFRSQARSLFNPISLAISQTTTDAGVIREQAHKIANHLAAMFPSLDPLMRRVAVARTAALIASYVLKADPKDVFVHSALALSLAGLFAVSVVAEPLTGLGTAAKTRLPPDAHFLADELDSPHAAFLSLLLAHLEAENSFVTPRIVSTKLVRATGTADVATAISVALGQATDSRGELQSRSDFRDRIHAQLRFFAALCVTGLETGSLCAPPNPLRYTGWVWLAEVIDPHLKQRQPHYELPGAIISFLEVAGLPLFQTFGAAFETLLNAISARLIPAIEQHPDLLRLAGGDVHKLKMYLSRRQFASHEHYAFAASRDVLHSLWS